MMSMTRRIGLAVTVLGLMVGATGPATAGTSLTYSVGGAESFSGLTGSGIVLPANTATVTVPDDGILEPVLIQMAELHLGGSLLPGSSSFTLTETFTVNGFTSSLSLAGTFRYSGTRRPGSIFLDTEVEFTSVTFGDPDGFLLPGGQLLTITPWQIPPQTGPAGAEGLLPIYARFELSGPAAVPEPASLTTAVLGVLMGLGYAWRRRRTA